MTKRALNEIIYDFKMRDVLNALFNKQIFIDFDIKRYRNQRKTTNVISYVITKTKIFYDVRHKSLMLKSKNKIFLRFNKKYKLFDKNNFKLFNQRVELFLIKRRIKEFVYELNLSKR